ncbi:C2 domain containing protein [Cocos nucifera]|uniref:C2 domain containing protein n=1 Tax=Cocos nucifera TaxID=13894 RepID=A0A8K0MXT4_COCNU|nr:C2 domain containing protein [Cocos nucifera]
MDSFKRRSGFCYGHGREAMEDTEGGDGAAFSGLLDIYVHHARDIHNICIYANQDVYAKFSLTCSPDEALSTRIVAGGGKNPQFDEHLKLKIPQPDAVLKCEIWMLSRAKNFLEDQLLGFTLVPLSSVATAKGKLTQDFSLSSTDLFHSPAGTVKLTLSFDSSAAPDKAFVESSTLNSSITSEVVLLDPADYGRIEFPDINVVKENQKMVSEYFEIAARRAPSKAIGSVEPAAPFLHLGASPQSAEDYDMAANSSEEKNGGSDSPDGGSIQNSGVFSNSTMTSLSDDRNSADSLDKKIRVTSNNSPLEANHSSGTSPDTPTSHGGRKESKTSNKEEAEGGAKENNMHGNVEMGSVFKSPLGNINLEAEQTAMQQQIVDMYMKSMQQFTESLAKMKLPMDLDKPGSKDGGDVIQSQNDGSEQQKKKDKSRVFYGSRAFF